MRREDIIARYARANPKQMIAAAAAMIAAIALLDWKIQPNVSLGLLYLFPILIAAGSLKRWQNVALAALCGILREAFGPFRWDADFVPRTLLVWSAFIATGLFVAELVRSREVRRQAEEELRVLIDTSPAAIVTLDNRGTIELANESARQLLESGDRPLRGESISSYLPFLGEISAADGPPRHFKAMAEEPGQRASGEKFLAHIWFSTYNTSSGPRTAAIVLDGSEDLREREDAGLQSIMRTSRVLMRSVSHEVRNLCEAGAAAYANMARAGAVADREDLKTLGAVFESLKEITSSQLRAPAGELPSLGLETILEELRIIVEPSCREAGAEIRWEIAAELPRVRGERHGILHILMNLAQNSLRAVQSSEQRQLTVTASRAEHSICVRLQDTGPGVAHPGRLFQPFQPGAEQTGLGLYVSRAIARSFGGDLRYEPQPSGSTFRLDLIPARGDQ